MLLFVFDLLKSRYKISPSVVTQLTTRMGSINTKLKGDTLEEWLVPCFLQVMMEETITTLTQNQSTFWCITIFLVQHKYWIATVIMFGLLFF